MNWKSLFGSSRRPTLLVIDDQPMRIEHFTDKLQEDGLDIVVVASADEAWEFFEKPQPLVCAILLDIMMPAGKYLTHVDTKKGTWTGLYLYQRIVECQCAVKPKGQFCPIAVLTNAADAELLAALQDASLKSPSPFKIRLWQKMGLSPTDFAREFSEWLRTVRKQSRH
jgi:CheY-like chemotaxis protein